MPEAFPTFHTDVRKAFAVDGQQVSIEQSLLSGFIVTKLALVHLSGWRRWLGFGLPVVVLQPVGEQRPLLVELFTAHLTLERGFAAQCMHLHVIVEAGFLVGGEVTVCTLVLFAGQNVLVVILSVSL